MTTPRPTKGDSFSAHHFICRNYGCLCSCSSSDCYYYCSVFNSACLISIRRASSPIIALLYRIYNHQRRREKCNILASLNNLERGGKAMYAETGMMFPYFHSFPQEVQQLQDFSFSQKPNSLVGTLIRASSISEYDLGGEGDLFKAPEPIIEEPVIGLDPMAAAISMISCGGDVITPQDFKVSDIDSSIDNGQLLSEVFYECKNDILAKEATEVTFSDVLDIKVPQENLITPGDLLSQGSFQKSVSAGCLSSMEWIHGAPIRHNFLDFPGLDLGAAYGMRRAFSEGDIKTLGNGNINLIHSPVGQPQIITSCTSEDRKEKLSRYRNKKTKRNFGRKIKYACRKALADSQPRIRGRFAKTEETDASKKQ